jgi:hypothetical protein
LLPKKVHALEHGAGASRGGVEPATERCVRPDALADAWRVRMVVSGIEVTQPLFRRQRTSAKAGELFGHLPHERLELVNSFDVRSSVV